MTIKSTARSTQRNRTFNLNPTTRAVRHALALGLAMAAAQPALAGTCDVSDPANAVCSGDFLGSSISYAIDDLTIIVGGDLPTVIQPLDGYAGIDLYAANGSITLTSAADILTSHAAAISVYTPTGDVHVENSGELEAIDADGIEAISYAGNVGVVNNGSIVAGTRGIEITSHSGDVAFNNATGALVSVIGADGPAYGVYAYSHDGSVTIGNEGVIDVTTVSYGSNAFGINAVSKQGDVLVDNSGSISAVTGGAVVGSMEAYGIYAASEYGNVTIRNSGDIAATTGGTAVNGPYGSYIYAGAVGGGIVGVSHAGNVAIENSGNVAVTSTGTSQGGSWVFGVIAHSDEGDVSVTNTETGSINVVHPYGYANGISAYSFSGSMTVDNAGGISVVSDFGVAVGIAAQSKYGSEAVTVSNSGNLSASGYSNAFGVIAKSHMGVATMDNSGAIAAESTYGGSATGVSIQSKYHAVDVINSGSIAASAIDSAYSHGQAIAISALTVYDGDIRVSNAGDIGATAYNANGVVATAKYGEVAITNSGDGSIVVDGARAAGIDATAKYDGGITVDNAGSITAMGRYQAVGVYANTMYGYYGANPGAIAITNSGDIEAISSNFLAFGVFALGYNGIAVTNSGDITATGYYANGLVAMDVFGHVSIDNQAGATIIAGASGGDATGALAQTVYGDVIVNNAGTISASSQGRAMGVGVSSYYGAAEVINAETGSILANGVSQANGVVVYGNEVARLTNYGSIAATADSDYAPAIAYGSIAAAGIAVTLNYGSIVADASFTGDGMAMAVGSLTYGSAATLVNEGSITATAVVDSGLAVAMGGYAYGEFNGVYNYGDVTASSSAGAGDAHAYGINSYAFNGSTVENTGIIASIASTVTGDASARAISNFAYAYSAYVTNDGMLSAEATSNYGNAAAMGVSNISWLYGNANTTNAGDIAAKASVTGYGMAQATGVYNYAFIYGPQMVNGGGIAATAIAAEGTARATGALTAFYHGDALVQNDGQIIATATVQGGQFGSADAYGVIVDKELGKYNFPNLAIVNHGDIVATAVHGGEYGFAGATGIRSNVSYVVQGNYGNIVARATTTGAYGQAEASGSVNLGKYGVMHTNDGSIVASATAHLGGRAYATAVSDVSVYTDAITINHGDIAASAISIFDGAYGGRAEATALYTHANYVGLVDNTGTITSHASADHGYASATGVALSSKYGVSTLANAGDIVALAEADAGSAEVTGTNVNSKYGAYTLNDGVVQATAIADGGGQAQAVGSVTLNPGAHGYFAYSTGSSLYNAGTILAVAQADGGQAIAVGARTEGSNDAGVRTYNNGTIAATADAAGGYAFAIGSKSWGYYGDVLLANYGDILARADGGNDGHGFATGALVIADGGFSYHSGNAILSNDGTIAASAHATIDATAIGVQMVGELGAQASNAGTISAFADAGTGIAQAAGISMYSSTGSITASNAGDITVMADGGAGSAAYGIHAFGVYGASVDNSGVVTAIAIADTYSAHAYGVYSGSNHFAYLNNAIDGDIRAVAVSQAGDASSVGAYASGWNVTTLTNYGDISAQASTATGYADAYGVQVYGGYVGIGLLINAGDIRADAVATGAGNANAVGAVVYSEVSSLFNDGSTIALASSDGGVATARGAWTYGMNSAAYNYGDLVAIADAGAEGIATAEGVYSLGAFNAYANNAGRISVEATGAQAMAKGVYNASMFDATTVNDGSIHVVAEGTLAEYGQYEAVAFGVYNTALYYNSIIDNSGSIFASASATTDITIETGFLVAKALGAMAMSLYGYGETAISNSGSIVAAAETSVGYASAWGAISLGGVYGSATLENDGLVASYAHTDIGTTYAVGAHTKAIAGSAAVVNHGDIAAYARAERGIVNVTTNFAVASGVQVMAPYAYGTASLDNYGSIEAHASALGGIVYAYGVQASATYTSIHNAAGASIVATGDAELFGGVFATGIVAGSVYELDLVNDGSITAYGHANAHSEGVYGFYGAGNATGISASSVGADGHAMVVNNGDVTAIGIGDHSVSRYQGGASATGIQVYAKYDADIVNAGNVTAIADAELGFVDAVGVWAQTRHGANITNAAGASIVSYASVGSLASESYGGRVSSLGVNVSGAMEAGAIYNAGDIIAHATVTPDGGANTYGSIAVVRGASVGTYSGIGASELVNVGDIEAVASADFGYATVHGAYVRALDDSTTTNSGDIRAIALADNGNAFAVGSYAYAQHVSTTYNCGYVDGYYSCDWSNPVRTLEGGASLIGNTGDILASASAEGGVGYSYGAVALGALTAGITNAGHITAVTEADDALAVGAIANSFYGDATLQNSGTIAAKATGEIANASGAILLGVYGVEVDNAGSIVAAAYGADATATAVSMTSSGNNTLTNSGSIVAAGTDATRIAVSSSADAAATIDNVGLISGSILTGNLDDAFTNGVDGVWNGVGHSDFGAGNNVIANAGTIHLQDATITLLGSSATASLLASQVAAGDAFTNTGLITVAGDNTIDLGLLGAFDNAGTIDFQDGAPDDTLTIAGDFGGDGQLYMDVSGVRGASDALYVGGSVVNGTHTINVNLVDVPTAASSSITVVRVAGDSTASSFALGDVHYNTANFLALDFDTRLVATINTANTAADTFALGMEVTGLNDTGTLAASVAPGAQSLMASQVGTWRQRMGVIDKISKHGLGLWARLFQNEGSIAPTQAASNFGQGGNFAFDQKNAGTEVGIDFAVADEVSLGLLLAKADGRQDLGNAGVGSSKLDGDTVGAYATWLSPIGFYVDASYRQMDFDARFNSAAGVIDGSGNADAFNLEAGYAWTLQGGLKIEPQVQYTWTQVDNMDSMTGALAQFQAEGGDASTGRVGVMVRKSFDTGTGTVWTPYASINAVHEFDGENAYSINDNFFGATSTEGTSTLFESGVSVQLGKLSVFGGFNWQDGGAVEGFGGGQLGVRYTW